ncbi:hypothetical protein [Candidatus Methanarcanum hacksteinii]|uniref:hypothetical protein n=1 Tax=Candidatus Methanarcanum hacksteinii TaxID=2911857 RepID=UPI0037DDD518|nr:MAG: hypothetical protein A3204_06330 [Candidatus Methanarcanum hacksteinii]
MSHQYRHRFDVDVTVQISLTERPAAHAEIDGEERRYPKFCWKDGSESTIIEDDSGRTIALDSSKEVIA